VDYSPVVDMLAIIVWFKIVITDGTGENSGRNLFPDT
jgi:hypothetical protein